MHNLDNNVIEITPAVVANFAERKLLSFTEDQLEFDLPEIDIGDEIIGTLTAEESKIFLAAHQASIDVGYFTQEIDRRRFLRLSELVGDLDPRNNTPADLQVDMYDVLNEEESIEYHELVSRYEYFIAFFWYSVSTRLSIFQRDIVIKNGFKVVATSQRYSKDYVVKAQAQTTSEDA